MSENDAATTETVETGEPTPADYAAASAAWTEVFSRGKQADSQTDAAPETTEEDEQPTEDDGNPNHEAAKWRTKFRESETQNTALATRLQNMQRAAIDTQVTALGMKPAALWASGAKLEDLVDDAGVPDAAKVQQAAQAAKDTLGIIAVKPAKPVGSLRSGATAYTPPRNKWVGAFSPRDE
ncbi:hypothetical protein MAHJHV49_22970 [Mycobacterium avium subsp. hominissuis]|uniref:Scaffolding protein n=1 Tax=Mycobacterium alsense TaxID=324058 RepID=A0AA42C0U5_9MYCO|nr:hypothetical protein [Mycobacterium alsense]MCV7382180.1 hypothetical protein [Mycobacterium alsense]OQZ90378.1 hypothetical protein BST11_13430 [Mycobacterium alsense]